MNINKNILLVMLSDLFEKVNNMCENNEKQDLYVILHTLDVIIALLESETEESEGFTL